MTSPPTDAESIDNRAVDAFAAAMKKKLAKARAKGRRGWQHMDDMELSQMLRAHVEKGDPVDVANFCMFLASMDMSIIDYPKQPGEPRGCLEDRLAADSATDAGLRKHPAVQALEDLNIPNLQRMAADFELRGEQRIPCFLQLEWVRRAAQAAGYASTKPGEPS